MSHKNSNILRFSYLLTWTLHGRARYSWHRGASHPSQGALGVDNHIEGAHNQPNIGEKKDVSLLLTEDILVLL